MLAKYSKDKRVGNKKLWLLLIKLLILFLFIRFFISLDLSKISLIIKNCNIKVLFLCFFIYLLLPFFRSIRWKIILSEAKINISFIDSFLEYTYSCFLGLFTPGKLGEFTRVTYLVERKEKLSVSFWTVLLDRLYDLFFLFFIGVFGLFVLKMVSFKIYFYLLLFFLLILGIFFAFRSKIIVKAIKALFFLKKISTKNHLKLVLLTFGAIFVFCIQYYLVAISMAIEVEFFLFSIICITSLLITLIPITFAGFGTREAVFVFFLLPFGYSREKIIFFSITAFIIQALGVAFWGVISFLVEKNRNYSNE